MDMFQEVPQKAELNKVDSSGMKLLDFQKLILAPGKSFNGNTGEYEICAVILGGKCSFKAGKMDFGNVGSRPNPFAGNPYSIYIPAETDYSVQAFEKGSVEIALCAAKSSIKSQPYLIPPEKVSEGTWGATNYTRFFRGILLDDQPAERLFVGETIVPSGNWATYPPHKHEKDNLPHEVYMEEIYYYQVNPKEGFALERHYSPAHGYDRADVIKNETAILMPHGYHTLVGAPGYNIYYIWFLAGNIRKQCPMTDPDLAWVQKAIPIIHNSRNNL